MPDRLKQGFWIAGGASAVIAFVAFVAVMIWVLVSPSNSDAMSPTGASIGVSGQAEDAIANKPWPFPSAGAAQPAPIVLPTATRTTNLGVATGYPKTPEGAVAQLAAYAKSWIEASPDVAKQINAEWIIPGGPGGGDSAEAMAKKQQWGAAISWSVTPTMGMIRGTSHEGDFVVACVLGNTSMTYTSTGTSQAAPSGGCSRMWWSDGRWMIENRKTIAPGDREWPAIGSAAAYSTGWSEIR